MLDLEHLYTRNDDTIVNFLRRVHGRAALADINLGNQGIWKGDEGLLIQDLRAIHGVNTG